jgi:hypothetical protein
MMMQSLMNRASDWLPSRTIRLSWRTIGHLPFRSTVTDENLGVAARVSPLAHPFLASPQFDTMKCSCASEPMPGAVCGEIGAVNVAQAAERGRSIDAQGLTGGGAQRSAPLATHSGRSPVSEIWKGNSAIVGHALPESLTIDGLV